MNRSVLRARISELLENYELSDSVKEELEEDLLTEIQKLEMELIFDEEDPEEGDDLDEG